MLRISAAELACVGAGSHFLDPERVVSINGHGHPKLARFEATRMLTHLQLMLVGRVGLQVEADKCRFIRHNPGSRAG